MHIEKTRFEGKARRGISPGTIYKTIWLLASLPRRLPTCHTMHHLPPAAASPPITLTAGQIFLREIVGIGSDLIEGGYGLPPIGLTRENREWPRYLESEI